MINVSYHARKRITERLQGLPIDVDYITARLNRVAIPQEKTFVQVCKFNKVVKSRSGDSSRGNILVAVVESTLLKTVVLTFSDSKSSQYSKRIIPDYKNI
jgi:hypothetical protein